MSWITTYTGKAFYPLAPKAEHVCIEDIAHHLATTNRFGGALREPVSVAQHSVLVARALPNHMRIHGLLHDAAEAYMPDFARPVKSHWFARLSDNASDPAMTQVREIENRLVNCIYDALGLALPNEETVAAIGIEDTRCLMTEKRDLLVLSPLPWSVDAEPWVDVIKPWPWKEAKTAFLLEFEHSWKCLMMRTMA